MPYLLENNHIFYTFSVIDLKQGNYNYVLSFPWLEASVPGVLTLYSFDIPRSSIPSIFVPMLPPDVPFFPGFKSTISIFDKNTTNPFIVDFYVFSGVVGGQPITASWADFNSESSIYKNLDFILSFTPIQNPSFTDTVSFGISSVIFWIQSILISLFAGDLSSCVNCCSFYFHFCVAICYLCDI